MYNSCLIFFKTRRIEKQNSYGFVSRNLDTELAFLLPALVDQNFQKAQVFCTSRSLSDLIGKVDIGLKNIFEDIFFIRSILDHKRADKTQFQCQSIQIEWGKFS